MVGFSFSPNRGKLLENLVFLALRRQTQGIYYFTTPTGLEVDFYLPDTRQLIQVAQAMHDPSTRERELSAIVEVLKTQNLQEGLILTETNQDPVFIDDKTIQIRSIAEWLLD